jgi:hypothetical protein
MSLGYEPVRLPFFRESHELSGSTKTEAEFGVDLCFLDRKRRELIVFVLKDEPLTYKNWTKEGFESDLARASTPDLSRIKRGTVKSVRIILVYNKDDDDNGIRSYERMVASKTKKSKKGLSIEFERWNLSALVEQVSDNLLSPSLLPSDLSGQLAHIAWQFERLTFGTSEWEAQLVQNWKQFLSVALSGKLDRRKLYTVPIALIILRQYNRSTPGSDAGWMDLIEWGMLAMWKAAKDEASTVVGEIAFGIWARFYVGELKSYLKSNESCFVTEHGFQSRHQAPGLRSISDAFVAFWNLGRLGLYSLSLQEIVDGSQSAGLDYIVKEVNWSANLVAVCLEKNPASCRPLVDLDHINIYLMWLALWQSDRRIDILRWFTELESRLLVRRIGKCGVPFIEARNRIDLVAECASTGDRPQEYQDSSSVLLLMVMEMLAGMQSEESDNLLRRYYKRLTLGIGDDGQKLSEGKIDLMIWVPPKNWEDLVLDAHSEEGTAVTIHDLAELETGADGLRDGMVKFAMMSRSLDAYSPSGRIPKGVLVLASMKNRVPIPPELWRGTLFPRQGANQGSDGT